MSMVKIKLQFWQQNNPSKTKFPLLFVAQGKTTQVENSQIGDVGYHWKAHSDSGWVTDEVFSYYFHKLCEHFNDDPLHLVMDLYYCYCVCNVFVRWLDLFLCGL